MWWIVAGYLTGRGLRNASLPDSVKQERYDAALARRAARRERRSPGPTPGQIVLIVAIIGGWLLLALVAQAVQ